MNIINKIINSQVFLIAIIIVNILLLIIYIYNLVKLKKINKGYKRFIKKLGNGNNIEEMLKCYIEKVELVESENKKIIKYGNKLENEISLCISKVGMVRYNAFKDSGSDLSFALALLNKNNSGVLLNGIYSREMSNIYAKNIINGESKNKLSEEENKAIDIALNQR